MLLYTDHKGNSFEKFLLYNGMIFRQIVSNNVRKRNYMGQNLVNVMGKVCLFGTLY